MIETASLGGHVRGVVGHRPEPQVIGPNARRIVAVMENAKPLGHWPHREFPCHSVSLDEMARTSDTYLPIAGRIATSAPLPAFSGPVYFGFEALRERSSHGLSIP
jgi:hypothetical protein